MGADHADTVALIRRHRSGDAEALEELFRRHLPRVRRRLRLDASSDA